MLRTLIIDHSAYRFIHGIFYCIREILLISDIRTPAIKIRSEFMRTRFEWIIIRKAK